MTTKITTDNIASETLTTILGPKVSSIVYPGDDTAANTIGGDSITLLGSGFNNGASVIVNGTSAGVVTVVSSTQITFTAPAQTAGTYVIYVINSDGGTAISIPGISYSGTPNWSTSAGNIGVGYETGSISTTVTASGDAPITYSVVSGTLPAGSSLNTSSGLISGTASATASSTTYSFTIKATDAQNQDTNRAFSITVNPDVVTWSSPANSTTYEVFKDIAIANVAMSATSASGGSITYTADTLPTGLSITGANIAGTPTVADSTSTTLTATSTSTRSATRTINWVISVANDIYFKNVTLLLNGETTATPFISDSSTNSFALTINGDTKPVLFNPYQEGYYSNYFNGSVEITVPNNAATQFGSSNFTIEGWFYFTSYSTLPQIMSGYNGNSVNNWALYMPTAGNLAYYLSSTGAGWNIASGVSMGATMSLNTWYHIALVRNSNTFTPYINGVVGTTTTSSATIYANNNPVIIGSAGGGYYISGYISNVRIVNGTAVYTSAFTPSTTPLTAIANTSLLTCQSNRFIDNSTNTFTLTATSVQISPNIPFTANSSYSTYGSAYFDGTGDTLTISSLTPGFSFGTGEFTIEMWVYKPSALNTVLLDARSSAAATPWVFVIDASNFPYFYDGTSYTSSVAVTLNSWNHVAVVRTSGVLKIFVNGVQGYSASYGTNLDRTAGLVIGDTVHAAGPLLGHISNLRIVKGTAVYTSAFTPPTVPLTAIANTSLLTCQYNGGATNKGIIDNSNFNNIITRNGNTSQGSFSPYSVTGWSNYFDGTGDYLTVPTTSTQNQWWTENFTIEAWVYPTNLSTWFTNTNPCLIGNMEAGSSTNYWSFGPNTNGTVRFKYFNGGSVTVDSTETISLNQWSHIAFVKDSNGIRIYVNGVGTTSTAVSGTPQSTSGLTIGQHFNSSILGYVSNIRVVKGTAVYTANFTPSTTPLTAISGTSVLTCQSNRLIDNSPNSFTLTRAGDVSVQAFDPFGSVPEAVPISYSNYFDGTGDYIQLSDNAAFDLGTGNFTIEFWFMRTATPTSTYHGIVGGNGSGFLAWSLYYTNGNEIMIINTSGPIQTTSGASIANNIWYHVAAVKNSGVLKMFINGVERYSAADSSTYDITNNGLRIGDDGSHANGWMNGYISNLRIVKGAAVYTSAFTPSTTPLTAIANTSLLTCQSTRMIDNSTNAFTITANGDVKPRQYNPFGYTAQSATSYTPSLHGGSVYFDGTGDSLTTPDIAFDLTTTTWCIEYWIYPTTIASGYYGLWALSTSGFRQGIYTDSVTHYLVVLNGGGGYGGFTLVAANKVITLNNWQHIALTSDGTTIRQFYNGVQTSTGSAASFSASTPTVGSWGGANYFTGYMSDFRITKGSAIYTSNFIPSTTSVTAIPNTSLLLNFNNGGIIDQHSSNVIETVGNAQLSTAVKKYNNASMYFDGTGDRLNTSPGVINSLGSGDFTIEGWVYPSSLSSMRILSQGTYAAGEFLFILNSNGSADFCEATTSRVTFSAGSFVVGEWKHFAIVRSGSGSNNLKGYINGTLAGTGTSSSYNYSATTAIFVGSNPTTGSQDFQGYIDDLRITKGYARYTSNFTAPTSAFITK